MVCMKCGQRYNAIHALDSIKEPLSEPLSVHTSCWNIWMIQLQALCVPLEITFKNANAEKALNTTQCAAGFVFDWLSIRMKLKADTLQHKLSEHCTAEANMENK